MEDLVLDNTLQNRMSTAVKPVEKRPSKATNASSPTISRKPLPTPVEIDDEQVKETPIEVPLSRPESPAIPFGHISLVPGQRNALQAELRLQNSAASEARQSIASLRKLALRLAVKIAVKEGNVVSHAKALDRARMSQYLASQSSSTLSDQQTPVRHTTHAFPLSPPLSPGLHHSKPLPSLPRLDSNGRITSVRFANTQRLSIDPVRNLDETLSSLNGSSTSLKDELNASQKKLAQLFESQAVLRERYNTEKTRSRQLDEECQQTHAKISSLEQSKQAVEDEAKRLHEYVQELEGSNSKLKDELESARKERHHLQDDLSKLQSSKLTLEHQLQVATGSKDTLEIQFKDLQKESEDVRKELEGKLSAAENKSKHTSATVADLESEKQKLDEDLKVTKFRLSAATDLEEQLRSQLGTLKDREFVLEEELQQSRDAVARLEKELAAAYDKMTAMDKSVDELNAQLQEAEEAKMEHEHAAELARASKERIGMHLKNMEKSRNKMHKRLRSTKSDLVLSKNRIAQNESEIEVLTGDLTRAQQRNNALEQLIEKAEVTVNAVVEKTNASVEHLAAIVAEQSTPTRPIKEFFESENPAETNAALEEQLRFHQKEIETLHQTNATLVAKLEMMTEELHLLKTRSRIMSRASAFRSLSSLALDKQLPKTPAGVITAEELYETEMQQLGETRATFNQVVRSLQAKSKDLEELEKMYDDDSSRVPSRASPLPPVQAPVVTTEIAAAHAAQTEGVDAKEGEVAVSQPTVITPDEEMEEYAEAGGFAKRVRTRSIAVDIETLAQAAETDVAPPLPPLPPLPASLKRPRPVPLKIKQDSGPYLALRSKSETHLRRASPMGEDPSFWRIGDISMIAAADADPKSPGVPRRSLSMTDEILRSAEMAKSDWPLPPRTPRTPFTPARPLSLTLNRRSAPEEQLRKGLPFVPDFLERDPYAENVEALGSSESLVASSHAIGSPNNSRPSSKQLPPIPLEDDSTPPLPLPLAPLNMNPQMNESQSSVNKELPKLPAIKHSSLVKRFSMVFKHEPLKRSKTSDGVPATTPTFSLFPRETSSPEMHRPSVSVDGRPFNAKFVRKSPSHTELLGGYGEENAFERHLNERRKVKPDPDVSQVALVVPKGSAPEPEEEERGRKPKRMPRSLRLRRSLSRLFRLSKSQKKELVATEEPPPPVPLPSERTRSAEIPKLSVTIKRPEESKTTSVSMRSLKALELEQQEKLGADAKEISAGPPPSSAPSSPGMGSDSPTPTRALFPSSLSVDADEPVGIYDPAAKMWLTPQKRKSSKFGVFDPESEKWLMPSPRTDSLLQTPPMISNHIKSKSASALSDYQRKRLSKVPEFEGDENASIGSDKAGESVEDLDDDFEVFEECDGALSLAEKLEIIRSPSVLRRSIHTQGTPSSHNTWHSAVSELEKLQEDGESTPKVLPWKASQILGIDKAPSIITLQSDEQDGSTTSTIRADERANGTEEKVQAPDNWDETSKNWRAKLASMKTLRVSVGSKKVDQTPQSEQVTVA